VDAKLFSDGVGVLRATKCRHAFREVTNATSDFHAGRNWDFAASMGICFLPEFTASVPGLVVRPVVEPDVRREACLVTVAGRRWSAPVTAFVAALRAYPWSHEPPIASAVSIKV